MKRADQAGLSASKGEVRRRQVIEAASDCFRREGFHGASIARISKVAGMSPGHIYHYFPNKEMIVSAIVEEDESELAGLIRTLDQDKSKSGFLEIVSSQIDQMVERSLKPEHLSLMLEIAAEAARNPVIAKILEESDQRTADRFAEMASRMGDAYLKNAEENPDLRARLEILPVLFAGLSLRSVHKGKLDKERMAQLIKDIIAYIWSAKA